MWEQEILRQQNLSKGLWERVHNFNQKSYQPISGELNHLISHIELQRLQRVEESYIRTQQEYENTIAELEEIIQNQKIQLSASRETINILSNRIDVLNDEIVDLEDEFRVRDERNEE